MLIVDYKTADCLFLPVDSVNSGLQEMLEIMVCFGPSSLIPLTLMTFQKYFFENINFEKKSAEYIFFFF